jgi:hypothetical protein
MEKGILNLESAMRENEMGITDSRQTRDGRERK